MADVTPRPSGPNVLVNRWRAAIETSTKAVELFGEHDITDPGLDCTNLRQGQVLDFSKATLFAKTTGQNVAIDFTNSTGLTVYGLDLRGPPKDLHLTGAVPGLDPDQLPVSSFGQQSHLTGEVGGLDPDEPPVSSFDRPYGVPDPFVPYIGVLLSRHTPDDAAAGKHRFYDLSIKGKWGLAGLYSIGSEVNAFFGCRVDNHNPHGLCAMYLSRRNNHGVQSRFTTDRERVDAPPLVPGNGATATGFMCSGLDSRSTLIGDRKATIILAGHSNASFLATHIDSTPAEPTPGRHAIGYSTQVQVPQRSHILVDSTTSAMDGLSFTNLQAQGQVAIGLRVAGAYSNGIAGLDFHSGECNNTRFIVDVGAVDLSHGTFDVASIGKLNVDPRASIRGCVWRNRYAGSRWPGLDWFDITQLPAPT